MTAPRDPLAEAVRAFFDGRRDRLPATAMLARINAMGAALAPRPPETADAGALDAAWEALLDCSDDSHGDDMAQDITRHRPLIEAAIRRDATPALDVAWAEAEAVLPEGWRVGELKSTEYRGDRERWIAMAWDAPPEGDDYQTFKHGYGDTPVEALRALTAALRAAETPTPEGE